VFTIGCGGGGGGGGSKVKVGFEEATSSVDEADVGSVVLVLTTKAPLAEAVTVTVADDGTGTATDAADYTFGAPQTVTFPMGSADGATQTVDVTALADTLVEAAAETMRLSLSNPSAGVAIKGSTHTLTVLDQNAAQVQFTEAAAATPDEQAGTFDATVELDLAPGDTLDVDVAVTVSDTGNGSATSGSDYTAFAPVDLTFASGAADGAQFTVQMSVLDDTDVESDETIVLGLSAPVSEAAATLGAAAEHVLSITEDDVAVAPFLSVSSQDGGPATDVDSGDSMDLGSQTTGAGPTAGITVTVSNLGSDPMSLSQLNLSGDYGDFALELLDGPATTPPPAELPVPLGFPLSAYGEDLLQGVYLQYDGQSAAALAGHDRVVLQGVPLTESEIVTLDLERVASPFTDDAVVRVDGVSHAPDEILGDLSLWRGAITGQPGSNAFLSFSSRGSHGFIVTGDGTSYDLVSDAGDVPQSRLVPTALLSEQAGGIAFECEELAPVGGLFAPGGGPGLDPFVLPEELTVGLTVADCRLAIETDYQLYQKFGDVGATTTYVTQLIAAISEQYREDAQVTLSIAYLGVHSTSSDGWTTPDGPGSTSTMLDEFKDAWDASGWPAAADLAHFISGANLGGGIAYVGALCNPFFGYGVSGNISGSISWAGWTGSPGSNTWDFVVVAHELGHNFGSSHTHSYCPPIDHCYANCDGTTTCGEGTIMSYCHACGGMSNIRIEFHPHIANVIRSGVASSCLGGTTLDGGASAQFQVRFEPHTSPGAKSATLTFSHDAANEPSPFTIGVSGTAQ